MNIISLVSYPFLPARTGGQKGIALFYKYFSRYHQLTIVTTEKNQPAFADGYELLNIIGNSKLRYINPFIFFRLRNLIRQKKATHLILEHPYYGWLGILLKRAYGVKLVVHSHNIEGRRWKSLGKWWWRILWNYEKITPGGGQKLRDRRIPSGFKKMSFRQFRNGNTGTSICRKTRIFLPDLTEGIANPG